MPRPTHRQIPLDLAPKPDYSFARFEVGPCNADAVEAVRAYPQWPMPVLALIGPPGSGKTHLASAWAMQNNAVIAHGLPKASWASKALLLDDASHTDEAVLFAVLNMALNGDVPGLLLTSDMAPETWDIELPDLQSRLKNVPVTILKEPDDTILELIIRKLFEDKGRQISKDLVDYLLTYQSRSVAALTAVISELDVAASQNKSDMTKAFAARYFSQRSERDLFSSEEG